MRESKYLSLSLIFCGKSRCAPLLLLKRSLIKAKWDARNGPHIFINVVDDIDAQRIRIHHLTCNIIQFVHIFSAEVDGEHLKVNASCIEKPIRTIRNRKRIRNFVTVKISTVDNLSCRQLHLWGKWQSGKNAAPL